MKLFSERRFDGVSISDVTAATGVNGRSIYAECRSNENLFDRVLRRYLAGPSAYTAEALTRPTAREVAEAMVHGAADTVSDDVHGCLTVVEAPSLAELRDATVHRLTERSMLRTGSYPAWTHWCWPGGSPPCARESLFKPAVG